MTRERLNAQHGDGMGTRYIVRFREGGVSQCWASAERCGYPFSHLRGYPADFQFDIKGRDERLADRT